MEIDEFENMNHDLLALTTIIITTERTSLQDRHTQLVKED